MLLAVDTATQMAGIALYDEAQGWVVGEEMWQSAENHTVEMMPRLVRLMEQQQVMPGDLTGLVVSLGPGSFTGVRIALSVMKGLSMALDLPLVGVPTLDVVAEPHKEQRLPICALLRAGRGRFAFGHYFRYRGRWRRRSAVRIEPLEKVCDEMEGPTLYCGEIDTAEAKRIVALAGDEAVVASPAGSLRRAAFLAELGWARLKQGSADDPATLSPIYLKQPG
ncbi:MAG TPA: tRNA (adenosine(37)-N6)-threonylcarbamoyltransferase complex dimerization subunit type 1 TsaB [Anaerolineae bacterium]|nr:tRNA (adenosine(37)-N6)-threonylcarbamoyltransferase complex dimerization subunit type 1 TsaB [Anaerolineae bacterium]